MEHLLRAIKNEKISSGVLILLLTGAWYVHGWANDEFVRKGEFFTLQEAVTDGFESIEINNASQVIRDVKLEMLITGVTGGGVGTLAEELGAAKKYKECLVKQEPNCQHLKDVE